MKSGLPDVTQRIWQMFAQFIANFCQKIFDNGSVIGNIDFSILSDLMQFIFFPYFFNFYCLTIELKFRCKA